MKKQFYAFLALAALLSACGQEVPATKKPTAAAPALAPMPGARPFKQEALPVPDKDAFSKSMAEADARAAHQSKAPENASAPR